MWNFVIHGAQELKMANDIDFSLHKDEFGSFLEVMSCIVFYFPYFIFGVHIFLFSGNFFGHFLVFYLFFL